MPDVNSRDKDKSEAREKIDDKNNEGTQIKTMALIVLKKLK